MTSQQLDEIRCKLNLRIANYKDGTYKYPPSFYSVIEGKLNQKDVDRFLDDFENQFKIVVNFYNSHKETTPTESECWSGVNFLKEEGVSKTMIEWFIESYGINIPQREFLYNREVPDISKTIDNEHQYVW